MKFFHSIAILLAVGGIFLFNGVNLHAGCEGTYMGVTTENPVFSSIDLTFSPFYSTASTSGTSECPNWDFAHYLDESRRHYLTVQRVAILEETSQRQGPHLNALAQMMGCRQSNYDQFSEMLHHHYPRLRTYLETAQDSKSALEPLKKWIYLHPILKVHCRTGIS